ncbi:TetR/AcrR family transcriptional regulator [Nocardia jejuensis]|uniref:TetR/AcrR family transcriptional regulator n=1 Tax=Nocardia jejuensis TaxID=328049 RepID=UPI00082BB9D8|nr:TetR/AcrR family transcriptional regulator [Nocardia jejuensis]
MTRTRMTASERGEEVLEAAIAAFAESGYAATKTDEIARRAGVSQPYVIRLFGTKQQLFLTASERVCDRIEEMFRAGAAQADPDSEPQDKLDVMGKSYNAFLADRHLPLVLLHSISASSEPAIGAQTRERYGRIYRVIRELTGASVEETARFMASGMLLTIMTAMQVAGPDAVPLDWAQEILSVVHDDTCAED